MTAALGGWTCQGSGDAESVGYTEQLMFGVTGDGTLTSAITNGDTIQCTKPSCTQYVPQDFIVTLTPTPNPGWVFTAWKGTCTSPASMPATCGAKNPVKLHQTATSIQLCAHQAESCYAVFSSKDGTPAPTAPDDGGAPIQTGPPMPPPPSGNGDSMITVNIVGQGTVAVGPDGVTCTSSCTKSFATNSIVSLTATPAAGSSFASWLGDCEPTEKENVDTVSLTQDKTCTAQFYNCQTDPPPVAHFTMSAYEIGLGKSVKLDATSSTGVISFYHWSANWPGAQFISVPVVQAIPSANSLSQPYSSWNISLTVDDYCHRTSQPEVGGITVD